jgi:regulator of sigma D
VTLKWHKSSKKQLKQRCTLIYILQLFEHLVIYCDACYFKLFDAVLMEVECNGDCARTADCTCSARVTNQMLIIKALQQVLTVHRFLCLYSVLVAILCACFCYSIDGARAQG